MLEYVDGEPIDRYCDTHRLSVDARVRLFLDALAAVAHAHANLIVHRNEKAIKAGTNPFDLGTQKCCALLKTESLLQVQAGL